MKKMISIFIWEVRQFDYYSNFVARLSERFAVEIIINDCVKAPISIELRPESFPSFDKLTLLSDALSVGYIRSVGISTGFQLSDGSYNLVTFFKYKIFVRLIKTFTNLLSFLYSKEKKGVLSSFHKRFLYIPERVLCKKLILFPRGLDIQSDFPGDMRSRFFDSALVISSFEKELAGKFEKPMWIVGYPRYWDINKKKKCELRSKFSDPSRPLIFWTPSRIDWQVTPGGNFKRWLPRILGGVLLNEYNLIVRPHPHTVELHGEQLDILKRKYSDFVFVDIEESREMGSIYSGSDVHLADYGGTIFSGVYCGCATILLDLDEASSLAPTDRSDVALRSLFISCSEDQNLPSKIRFVLGDSNYKRRLRSNIFGVIANEYPAFLNYLDASVD